jgi:hypothetical protein
MLCSKLPADAFSDAFSTAVPNATVATLSDDVFWTPFLFNYVFTKFCHVVIKSL